MMLYLGVVIFSLFSLWYAIPNPNPVDGDTSLHDPSSFSFLAPFDSYSLLYASNVQG